MGNDLPSKFASPAGASTVTLPTSMPECRTYVATKASLVRNVTATFPSVLAAVEFLFALTETPVALSYLWNDSEPLQSISSRS